MVWGCDCGFPLLVHLRCSIEPVDGPADLGASGWVQHKQLELNIESN